MWFRFDSRKKRDFDFSLKTHDGCGGLCRCRSVCLLMQAALPCMLFARGPMRLHLRGGTNAAFAPQIDYCMQVRPHTQPHSRILMHCLPCTELPLITYSCTMPSVLWRCWLGGRKGIWPVKNWVVGCWRGYLSGARCRLAYGPADATATHCLLLQ